MVKWLRVHLGLTFLSGHASMLESGTDDLLEWGILGRRKDKSVRKLLNGGSRVVFELDVCLTTLQHVSAQRRQPTSGPWTGIELRCYYMRLGFSWERNIILKTIKLPFSLRRCLKYIRYRYTTTSSLVPRRFFSSAQVSLARSRYSGTQPNSSLLSLSS